MAQKETVGETISGKYEIAKDAVKSYIQENPVKSVLIAAAAGAVLGAMMARKR